jgi:hypothetical protein
VLGAEIAAIRRSDPDLDPGHIAGFTLPILGRVLGVGVLGVVPLLVVRNSADENSHVVPVIGSLALVVICAAVVAWMFAVVISGLIVMILYRTKPSESSHLVLGTLTDSFRRIEDSTSALALLALLAGLLSLAFGLPTRSDDKMANPVLDDLVTAQVGVLLVALSFGFIAESIRLSASIVDDQSLLLAWPWALAIACVSWVLATVAGPFEATRMLTILLNEWLPAYIDGNPRAQMISEAISPSARWWVAFGPLPVIAGIWAYQASRLGGFTHIRQFLADDTATNPGPQHP